MSLTLVIHPDNPEQRKLATAAKILDDGGVVFYPTDTVYALGCALDAKRAVERLFRLKRMDPHQKLAVVCADLRDIARYGQVSDFAYRQMRRLIPGPYTFVLEATREVPRILLDKRRTVGVRVPNHNIAQALVKELGRPLLTTSAIPPGTDEACHDVAEAKEAWPSGIDVFIDGGPVPGGLSTVVSLIDDAIEVLREGLGAEEL